MNKAKRHYYKFQHPQTRKIKELWYERAITIQKNNELIRDGYVQVLEIYIDPFVWKIMKQHGEGAC